MLLFVTIVAAILVAVMLWHNRQGVARLARLLGWFLIAAFVYAIATGQASPAESTAQRDAPTVRFYTPDGKAAGTAVKYGNTTRFYGPDGKPAGTAYRTNEGKH